MIFIDVSEEPTAFILRERCVCTQNGSYKSFYPDNGGKTFLRSIDTVKVRRFMFQKVVFPKEVEISH
jgi:hypothetical protein